MGYCISQVASDFFIRGFDKKQALDAARSLAPVGSSVGGGSVSRNGQIRRMFSWMNDVDIANIQSLEEMLTAWRYEPKVDPQNGNIIGVQFMGEKLGDELYLFEAIAPFVKNGSFIEMVGEDGERWRWTFRNGFCKEVEGKVIFDE